MKNIFVALFVIVLVIVGLLIAWLAVVFFGGKGYSAGAISVILIYHCAVMITIIGVVLDFARTREKSN